jgi:hypothetical protein
MKKILIIVITLFCYNISLAQKISHCNISECTLDIYCFVKEGRVYEVSLFGDKFLKYENFYVYKNKSYCLTGNLSAINQMLKTEASSSDESLVILRTYLSSILNIAFCNGYYIDDAYIKKEQRRAVELGELAGVKIEDRIEYKEYFKKLMTYKRDCEPKIFADGTWAMECSIRTYNGGVYLWNFKGTVFPLQITTFKQDIVAETEIFEEILTIGN